jgi:hypothetical protein
MVFLWKDCEKVGSVEELEWRMVVKAHRYPPAFEWIVLF